MDHTNAPILETTISKQNTHTESLRRPSRSDDKGMDDQHGDLTRIKSIAQQMSPLREFFFVGILCGAQFTTQMGLGQTLAILHIIADSLQITDPGVLSWLIAGYSLTVGTFILLSGRLGDMFGYKEMMVIGYSWYAIWSMISGLAVYSGKVLFIFARVMSGIGPAILLPNALGLLGATYAPGERKNMVFSLFGACAPMGSIVGGLFAGLWSLLENGWPWTFYTTAIALFILAALSVVILPSVPIQPAYRNLSFKQKFVELDILGATVGITAMILFNFAWNQAPGFGWEQPYVYVLLIIGILLFPVFIWIEFNIAAKPLVPFRALSGNVTFVLGCVCCGWASFGIWIYYIFQFLQILREESPLLSVAHMCPVIISGFAAALTTGKVIGRLGPGWVMFVAMCAFLTGNVLVATVPIHQSYWAQIFVCTIITPWGMDMSFPAATLMLSNSVKKEHQGMGASLVNTVVNYSISIGVGIAGTVDIQLNRGGRTQGDILIGYRSALYMAIGLSGLGVFISLLFLLKMHHAEKKQMHLTEKQERDSSDA